MIKKHSDWKNKRCHYWNDSLSGLFTQSQLFRIHQWKNRKRLHLSGQYFLQSKGITIQQYIIIHKIERVKELLLYDELNLTEMSAYQMHYSSVAHLSNQFKQVTGLSPSFFKQLKQKRKQNLEKVWYLQYLLIYL